MRSSVLVVLAVVVLCCTVLSVSGGRAAKRGSLEAADGCVDVKPSGSEQYTCQQQKAWDKCNEAWMKGFCQKTCGTCGGSAVPVRPSNPPTPAPVTPAPAPTPAPTPVVASNSLAVLKISGDSSRTAPLKSYGASYAANKAKVVQALQGAGLSSAEVRLLLAIGMLETNTFDPQSRDTSKTGASTNWSAFNIDMLERAGVTDYQSFNSMSALAQVARGLKQLLTRYGVDGFLNYLRGGYTGWQTTTAYGCVDYRNAIASMVRIIDENPSLITDDRRIDMVVAHV